MRPQVLVFVKAAVFHRYQTITPERIECVAIPSTIFLCRAQSLLMTLSILAPSCGADTRSSAIDPPSLFRMRGRLTDQNGYAIQGRCRCASSTQSTDMSGINIYTLPRTAKSTSSDAASIREDIERGLIGSEEATVPGKRPEDRRWSFKRSVPTVVLYDEQGLRLYDNITSKAHEYYLFEDELNLIKTHGDEIARCMGFPGKERRDRERERAPRHAEKRWRAGKWGDTDVGKWNMGVNGEEGMGGGWDRGYDVVELGAGALRKTAHLLMALSEALPDPPSDASSLPPPITYHPLDLSHPELHRVLGEMNDAYGTQLDGKVSCIGLHGDYEAGLQMIRDDKLHELRGREFGSGTTEHEDALSIESSSPIAPSIPMALAKDRDAPSIGSPPSTSASSGVECIRPEDHTSPMPSAVTDVSSDVSNNGTWSPISSEEEPQEEPLQEDYSGRPLHYLFLGSSLGNFDRDSAAPFLKSLPLKPGDTLLLGLDGRPPPGEEGKKKVEMAYNDPAGHTRAFEEHGWDVVKKELGIDQGPGVEFVGRYNEELGRHEAYFKSLGTQTINLSSRDVTLDEGELLNIEWSFKYSKLEALELFDQADLSVVNSWQSPSSEYRLWLLERPPVRFSRQDLMTKDSKIAEYKGIPKWEEWIELWRLWDHITLAMCPEKMLHTKPIDLRHICLFYLGHIPTFLDIYLTRMTNGKHTEPEHYKDIFERGIDPDMDDPTKIHAHSEVPVDEADWPLLSEVLTFRDRVRARLRGIYDDLESGKMTLTRRVGRTIFMGYEHEAQHAETLLYMLAQSGLTVPPGPKPEWEVMQRTWEVGTNKVLSIPGRQIEIGHNDVEDEDEKASTDWKTHEFGWDEENPVLTVRVGSFKADALPITNGAYLEYMKTNNIESIPESWRDLNTVRTFYGPLDMSIAKDWPLMASKNEIEAFANWKGGRLPTEAELRVLWESEDGPRVDGESSNIGFRHWHPVPPTLTKKDHSGRMMYGHNGGVWEWTSTPLEGYEGYVPSGLYPGYSADFFDGKHYVVLGGSYATIPQIASRKSFRNWYQASYGYSFIGGRVVYDA